MPIDLHPPGGGVRPDPFHWALWKGGFPHCKSGQPLIHIEVPEPRNEQIRQQLKSRQIHAFSVKPPGGHYVSYLAKARKYISFVMAKAREIDPTVSELRQ
ncbi:MAG: hypothetical protein OXG82_00330 [Gammaproteobacteria bacterium]|nr:hypothetical protein [Gammaproteobacteria bacterium]